MKIALIISGMSRTYKQAHASIFKYLIPDQDCDIYLHSWNIEGNITFALEGDKVQKGVTRDYSTTEDELIAAYHPKKL